MKGHHHKLQTDRFWFIIAEGMCFVFLAWCIYTSTEKYILSNLKQIYPNGYYQSCYLDSKCPVYKGFRELHYRIASSMLICYMPLNEFVVKWSINLLTIARFFRVYYKGWQSFAPIMLLIRHFKNIIIITIINV